MKSDDGVTGCCEFVISVTLLHFRYRLKDRNKSHFRKCKLYCQKKNSMLSPILKIPYLKNTFHKNCSVLNVQK